LGGNGLLKSIFNIEKKNSIKTLIAIINPLTIAASTIEVMNTIINF
jgi:hypothetical protein